jgi:hypothetical protein
MSASVPVADMSAAALPVVSFIAHIPGGHS